MASAGSPLPGCEVRRSMGPRYGTVVSVDSNSTVSESAAVLLALATTGVAPLPSLGRLGSTAGSI